ncbi:MAG: hypothetical protein ACP5NA_00260 [Candidatus Acidulodesulfobacterium sp.]
MKRFVYCTILNILLIFYIFLTPKLSLCMPDMQKGQIYNTEAQNIVNTADLLIKAEHAYFQNTGTFTDISGLENNNPAYLSPIKIYNFQGDTCLEKLLFKSTANICINLQNELLEIYIPLNLADEDIVAKEISIGITGKAGQISDINGLGAVTFALNNNPAFFNSSSNSNPAGSSSVSSVNVSPNANGGLNYTNVAVTQDNLLTKVTQAITNFFASVVSLF